MALLHLKDRRGGWPARPGRAEPSGPGLHIVLAPLGSEGEGIATRSTKRKGDLGGPKHWGKLRPLLPGGVPVGQLMQQHWHCWRICHGWLRFSELTGELQVSKGAGREGRGRTSSFVFFLLFFTKRWSLQCRNAQRRNAQCQCWWWSLMTGTETDWTILLIHFHYSFISISSSISISIYYLFHFGFCCSGAYGSHPRPMAWKKKIYCVNQCWSAYIFRSYQLDSNSKHMRKQIRLRMTWMNGWHEIHVIHSFIYSSIIHSSSNNTMNNNEWHEN